MRYWGWWFIPLLCVIDAGAQPGTEGAEKELRSALRQVLVGALAEGSKTSTRQIVEETADRSGLTTAAVRGSLLVMLGRLGEEIGEDGDIYREIDRGAAEVRIEAKKGRKLVRGLASRLRKIVAKDQVYLVEMLVEGEAKKAGIPAGEASWYLRQLVRDIAPVMEGASEDARGLGNDRRKVENGGSSSVDQIPPETGLVVEGRSSYDFETAMRRQMSRPAERNAFVDFFGSRDEGFIIEQTADLHRSIQPLLLEKIRQSPLNYVRWSSDYRLSYDVLALDVWRDTEEEWTSRSATCMAQIGVKLQQISTATTLFEKKPPLIVLLHKEKPGGPQKLDSLYEDAAGQILQTLDQYWFEEREGR